MSVSFPCPHGNCLSSSRLSIEKRFFDVHVFQFPENWVAKMDSLFEPSLAMWQPALRDAKWSDINIYRWVILWMLLGGSVFLRFGFWRGWENRVFDKRPMELDSLCENLKNLHLVVADTR